MSVSGSFQVIYHWDNNCHHISSDLKIKNGWTICACESQNLLHDGDKCFEIGVCAWSAATPSYRLTWFMWTALGLECVRSLLRMDTWRCEKNTERYEVDCAFQAFCGECTPFASRCIRCVWHGEACWVFKTELVKRSCKTWSVRLDLQEGVDIWRLTKEWKAKVSVWL